MHLDDPEAIADAASLAESFVVRTGRGGDSYWDDTASSLLQGLIPSSTSMATFLVGQ